MKRLSYLLRETKGRVFRDDEFATHLKRVAVSEDDLPADGFFAIGAGGPPDASSRVEDFVGPAIDRRHPSSVSTSEVERDAVRERPYAPAGSRLSFIGIGHSGQCDTARRAEEILATRGAIRDLDLYTSSMAAKPKAKPRGAWTAEEVARHEQATQAQVAHDRERGVSVNLEEAAKLSRFANRFSDAFRHARHGA